MRTIHANLSGGAAARLSGARRLRRRRHDAAYARFLADAETHRYDIDRSSRFTMASFEQVAHRLVTLRRPGQQGIPFGFLRAPIRRAA